MLRYLIAVLVVVLGAHPLLAADFGKNVERDSISLNGTWQTLREHGNEEIWKPEVAAAQQWADVSVPGGLAPGSNQNQAKSIRFVWARKTITLDAPHAGKAAVLRWDGIRFGATAWLNGHKLAEHAAVGPNTVLIPSGITKPGANVLLLKVPGWSGVMKSKSGYPLMPCGAATQWGAKNPAIVFSIWMEFYSDVYMKHVLAMPDLAAGTVTFRVHLDCAGTLPANVNLEATVLDATGKPGGSASLTSIRDKNPADVVVKLDSVHPWSLETRYLYTATLRASTPGKKCDEVSFRFGMREFRVQDGHFALNGKPVWLRGSNLVNEWNWGEFFNENARRFIIDEARNQNLNCFRTHTSPPPHSWLNIADEHGVFILAEFPVLYNYQDFKYTPQEYEVFHANALLDARGWVTSLWNHPSVVIWVLSNESRRDDAFETGPLQDLVNNLDPTRITMRTGTPRGTREVVHIHTCGNYSGGSEGSWVQSFAGETRRKDPKRAFSNSEYMNRFGENTARWLGVPSHSDAGNNKAEVALEHTEAMRRLNYDCLLPYMYSGWTRLSEQPWRPEFISPMAAALHSAMAPVLASLDLFDRNFSVGQEVTTPVVLINELNAEVHAKLDLYVTANDPLLIPEPNALKAALSRQSFNVTLKPASMSNMTVTWKLPEKEGSYWLALVASRAGDKPVVSQRVVRAIAAPPKLAALKSRRVVILGPPDKPVQDYLTSRGVQVRSSLAKGKIDTDIVLVGDSSKVSADEKALTPALLDWVKADGRLIVLDPGRWDWNELVPFTMARNVVSRVFPYPNSRHYILNNVDPLTLRRWNTIPSIVSDSTISTAAPGASNVLWSTDNKAPSPVVVSIPTGKGEILLCCLKLRARISPSANSYDPAAERVFANLIGP